MSTGLSGSVVTSVGSVSPFGFIATCVVVCPSPAEIETKMSAPCTSRVTASWMTASFSK